MPENKPYILIAINTIIRNLPELLDAGVFAAFSAMFMSVDNEALLTKIATLIIILETAVGSHFLAQHLDSSGYIKN